METSSQPMRCHRCMKLSHRCISFVGPSLAAILTFTNSLTIGSRCHVLTNGVVYVICDIVSCHRIVPTPGPSRAKIASPPVVPSVVYPSPFHAKLARLSADHGTRRRCEINVPFLRKCHLPHDTTLQGGGGGDASHDELWNS